MPPEPSPEPPRPASSAERPSWSRRLRGWLWHIALLALVYAAVSAWQERRALGEGTPLPPFALSALDGKTVTSDELRGQRVLLHFWATWCGVCRMEVGSLNALQRSLPADARLISVVADGGDVPAVRRFVAEHGVQYPVLLGDSATLRQFGVSAFPTSYYLDPEGRVDDVTVGMSTRWVMRLRLFLAD